MNMYVPAGVAPEVEMFNVDVVLPALGVTEEGVNTAETPDGAPDTDSPTAELNPSSEVTVIV